MFDIHFVEDFNAKNIQCFLLESLSKTEKLHRKNSNPQKKNKQKKNNPQVITEVIKSIKKCKC